MNDPNAKEPKWYLNARYILRLTGLWGFN